MTTTEDALNTYRASDDYQAFLAETLDHAGVKVGRAQAALNDAEQSRRVSAVIAVRGGMSKVATANKLGVSRPTLDAWILAVEAEPDEMASVLQHEQFVTREMLKS